MWNHSFVSCHDDVIPLPVGFVIYIYIYICIIKLSNFILYDIIWYYMILYDIIWFHMILYDNIIYYIILSYLILSYLILYDMIWYDMILDYIHRRIRRLHMMNCKKMRIEDPHGSSIGSNLTPVRYKAKVGIVPSSALIPGPMRNDASKNSTGHSYEIAQLKRKVSTWSLQIWHMDARVGFIGPKLVVLLVIFWGGCFWWLVVDGSCWWWLVDSLGIS